jgi:hypothetical protein
MEKYNILCYGASFRGILAVMGTYIRTFYPDYVFRIMEKLNYDNDRSCESGCVYHSTGEVCFSFSVHKYSHQGHLIIFYQFDSFFDVFEKIVFSIKSIMCEMLDATPKTQETLLLMAIKSPDSTMKSFTGNLLYDRELFGLICDFISQKK